MRFLILLEYMVFGLVLLLFFSQIFLPLWRGTPLFPLFRRERKLEAELTQIRQEGVEAELAEDIAQARERVGHRRKGRGSART